MRAKLSNEQQAQKDAMADACEACKGSGHKDGKAAWHRFAGHVDYPCFRCGRDACPACRAVPGLRGGK